MLQRSSLLIVTFQSSVMCFDATFAGLPAYGLLSVSYRVAVVLSSSLLCHDNGGLFFSAFSPFILISFSGVRFPRFSTFPTFKSCDHSNIWSLPIVPQASNLEPLREFLVIDVLPFLFHLLCLYLHHL